MKKLFHPKEPYPMSTTRIENFFYNVDGKRIPKTIKLLRLDRKLTQKQLAKYVGRGKNYIYFLEAGERPLTVSGLKSIAEGLKINSAVLLYLFLEIDKRDWFKEQTCKLFDIEEVLKANLDSNERVLLNLLEPD